MGHTGLWVTGRFVDFRLRAMVGTHGECGSRGDMEHKL